MTTIAFVGLGAMGSRMANRLVGDGHDVVVWNRTRQKATPLAERGAGVAETPAEAAKDADAVITMVTDPAALRAVTEGEAGALSGIHEGATLIEMSTVGPATIESLASKLPAGVSLIDAPVLGGVGEAEAGSLNVFVGGEREVVTRWMPLLSSLGTPFHVGPLGSGAAAKLVANTTLFGLLATLGEALALADALELPRDAAFEVLMKTRLAPQVERNRPAIESGEYPRRFALSLARKDADLILDAAERAGADLRLTAAARAWLAEAERAGLGDSDYSAVLQQILGTRTPNREP